VHLSVRVGCVCGGEITNSGEVIQFTKLLTKSWQAYAGFLCRKNYYYVVTYAAAEVKNVWRKQTWRWDNDGQTKNKKTYIFLLLRSAFFSRIFFFFLISLYFNLSWLLLSSNFYSNFLLAGLLSLIRGGGAWRRFTLHFQPMICLKPFAWACEVEVLILVLRVW